MSAKPLLDVGDAEWSIVQRILQQHVPEREVWAFGSRAKWTSKEFSDLDLAIIGQQPLTMAQSTDLADAFSESDLPWKVDVVDWVTTSESFRKIIERDKVVVQVAGNGSRIGRGMGSEWPLVSVDEVCSLIVDCVNKTAPVVPDTTPYRMIRTTNVRNGRIDLSDCKYVTEDTYQKWTRRSQLQVGDVILTREAPIGEVGYVTQAEGVFLGQRLMQYRPNPAQLDARFLLYSFLSPVLQHQFGSHEGSGSVVSHIRVGDCFKFKLRLPPLNVQREVASILGALDDRITLLRETNATLEAIAQALFKSWFVDFDPVRAKMEGRAPEGMDEATAALFPDAFEETDLGLVPRGWRVTTVGKVAEVVKGKSYSSKDLVDNHHTALVTLKSFERGGGFRMDGFKPFSGAYKPSQVVAAGDLIVAYTDVTQAAELIGKPAVVVGVNEYATLVASLDVGIVRPDECQCGKQFLYGLFRTDMFQAHTLAHTSGTTVLHLAKDGVGSFAFALPPYELTRTFERMAEAIALRKQSNSDAARTLTTLRDTLLPRLISGQLRLPEAEQQVEEALA